MSKQELDKLYETALAALETSQKAVTTYSDAVKKSIGAPSDESSMSDISSDESKADSGVSMISEGGKTKKYKLSKKKRRGLTKRKR